MNLINLGTLYLSYEHKKWIPGTIPRPYFPKTEDTNNKYSLTYKEWNKIIDTYLKYVFTYLLQGDKFTMPNRLGFLQMKKYRTLSKINWQETIVNNKVTYFKNLKTDNFSPVLKWRKNVGGFSTASLWKLRPNKSLKRFWGKEILKNPSIVLNYSE